MALGNLSMLKHLLSPKAPGRARGHGDKAKRHRRAYSGQRRPLGTAPPRPAPPGLPATAPASCGEVSFQRTSVFSLRTVTDLKSRGTGDGFFWGGGGFFGLLFFYPDVAADQRYLHVWG